MKALQPNGGDGVYKWARCAGGEITSSDDEAVGLMLDDRDDLGSLVAAASSATSTSDLAEAQVARWAGPHCRW